MCSDSRVRYRRPLFVTCAASFVVALTAFGAAARAVLAEPEGAATQPSARAAATQPSGAPQAAPGEIIIRPTGKRRVVSVAPPKPTRDAEGNEYGEHSVRLPLGYRRDELVHSQYGGALYQPLRDEAYAPGYGYGGYLSGAYPHGYGYGYGYGGRHHAGYGYGHRPHHSGYGHGYGHGYGSPSVGGGHVPGYGYGSGYGFGGSSGYHGSRATWTPSGGGSSRGGGRGGGSFSGSRR